MTIDISPVLVAALNKEYHGIVIDRVAAQDLVEVIVFTWLKQARDSRRLVEEHRVVPVADEAIVCG